MLATVTELAEPNPTRTDRRPFGQLRAGQKKSSALVLLALVVGGGWLVLRPEGRSVYRDGGPIEAQRGRTLTAAQTEVGQPMTYSLIDLRNTTDKPAIVEGVRLTPRPDPEVFEVMDILVADPSRPCCGGGLTGFPPPGHEGKLHSVRGAVVPPKGSPGGDVGLNLVIGSRLTKPGYGFWRQIEVDFRVGQKGYTVIFEDAYVLCAPAADYEPKGCPDPRSGSS